MPVKLPSTGSGGSSGGGITGGLNLFTGTTTPATKHGIWINTSQTITNVVQDNDVWTPNTFYNTGVTIANTFFANSAGTNNLFYYNGYIYKFQSNTSGTGLFRASIDTAAFSSVKTMESTNIPRYGAVQDQNNPRYVYGVSGSSDSDIVCKYDLETGTLTAIGTTTYYPWSSAYQNAAFYDNVYYGFYHTSSSQGGYPSGIYKYDIATKKFTSVMGASDLSYPRMITVGSNLYILYAVSKVLNAKKINLITGAQSTLTLSGSTTIVGEVFGHAVMVTDNANKIYFMTPYSSTSSTVMSVLNVDTGVVSSYSASGTLGVKGAYFGMLYYNGTVYIYGMNVTSSSVYSIYHFKLTGKSYPTGTFVISRTDNNGGVYNTELISPKKRPTGTYNMFKTGYNMAYISINGQLSASQAVYNGDGSSWVKIR